MQTQPAFPEETLKAVSTREGVGCFGVAPVEDNQRRCGDREMVKPVLFLVFKKT